MDYIMINIPDPSIKTFVDQIVVSGKYPSAGDYLLELIRKDRARRARLEALLVEGLHEGDAIVMTDETCDEMTSQFESRHADAVKP